MNKKVGRPEVKDPKQTITIGVEKSIIEKHFGVKPLIKKIKDFIYENNDK